METPATQPEKNAPKVERVLNLELPVVVVLAEQKMALGDVLSLSEGQVLSFKKNQEEPLGLLVNNSQIGTGRAVKIGEKFGLEIRDLGRPPQIVMTLAGLPAEASPGAETAPAPPPDPPGSRGEPPRGSDAT